jgi:hypothetical protein
LTIKYCVINPHHLGGKFLKIIDFGNSHMGPTFNLLSKLGRSPKENVGVIFLKTAGGLHVRSSTVHFIVLLPLNVADIEK